MNDEADLIFLLHDSSYLSMKENKQEWHDGTA
jgi:hypothetical protein